MGVCLTDVDTWYADMFFSQCNNSPAEMVHLSWIKAEMTRLWRLIYIIYWINLQLFSYISYNWYLLNRKSKNMFILKWKKFIKNTTKRFSDKLEKKITTFCVSQYLSRYFICLIIFFELWNKQQGSRVESGQQQLKWRTRRFFSK